MFQMPRGLCGSVCFLPELPNLGEVVGLSDTELVREGVLGVLHFPTQELTDMVFGI